ncbi:VWA domain-containing protein [Flavisphingomonas formosensis]|uniref:VWA domain-containing protein n=1 Tax=Flavisphingomonas formosensis TaxID=861534 RepID=UPI0012F9AEB2|nr:VWA domain-containing protein [Sphingomonas formosensis]
MRCWIDARLAVLAALAIPLSACSGGKDREANSEPATDTASTGLPKTAREYVDSFITEDSDRCFGKVELEKAVLEKRRNPIGTAVQPTRVIIAIDGSGSMAGLIGGQTKLALARQSAIGFIDGLPSTVQASLLVFGQQGDNSEAGKAKSCRSVDILAPMSADHAGLIAAVKDVRATGWTPLAAGLERAQALLDTAAKPGEQVIYVVSDGEETCGGDPVAVARRINAGNTRAVVNIIGFGLPSKEAAALKAVADAGGGGFVNVLTGADFDRTIAMVRESNRQSANAVRTSNAMSRNAVNTSDVVSDASLCISDLVDGESKRMSDDLSARWKRGEKVPFSSEALRLARERHRALLDRAVAFSKKLGAEEEAASSEMRAAENVQR